MIYNVDYVAALGFDPRVVAVKGHPTEQGANDALLQQGAQRLHVRGHADLNAFDGRVLLALYNHLSGTTIEALPADADVAIWDVLQPRPKNNKEEGLRTEQISNTTSSPGGAVPPDERSRTMANANEKAEAAAAKAKEKAEKAKAKAEQEAAKAKAAADKAKEDAKAKAEAAKAAADKAKTEAKAKADAAKEAAEKAKAEAKAKADAEKTEKKAAADKAKAEAKAKADAEKAAKAEAKAKANAEKAAKAAEPKVRVLKTDGIVYRIKVAVLGQPSISTEDLVAKMKGEGFEKVSESTVATFRQDFVHSLRFLKANGFDIPNVEA